MSRMKSTILMLGLLVSSAALAQQPAAGAETQEVAALQTREVIERLKMMRAQLLLEQEYNRVLEAMLERAELEAKLAAVKGGAAVKDARASAPPPLGLDTRVRGVAPPPRLGGADQLIVKAVTVAPFKEAIVVYNNRVYTVRPGDKLGNIEIRDITESGVVTGGGKATVVGGQ
jgi:LysM repeat protein